MNLLLLVLSMVGFGLHTQSAPLQGHRFQLGRYRRAVPATSFAAAPPNLSAVPVAPAPAPVGTVNIIKQTGESSVTGEFVYSFEADNGIKVEAKGYQKPIGPNEEGQAMEGQYSYTAPDGTPVIVQWTADETGFHANIVKKS